MRRAAVRNWGYIAVCSTSEHNWLVPDNLQEEPFQIAARVSPTNIGFLLNAQQVACEFGYLTVPELAQQTSRPLAVIRKLPRHHGHLYNWHDTRTFKPLPPLFVSCGASGNLYSC